GGGGVWEDRSAAERGDEGAGPGVRGAIFERLPRLKFELPCSEVSAAWLGARLYYREGSAPLGYIPGDNWTRTLCEGMAHLLDEQGVRVRLGTRVRQLHCTGSRVEEVELFSGERLRADVVVSSVPVEVYLG